MDSKYPKSLFFGEFFVYKLPWITIPLRVLNKAFVSSSNVFEEHTVLIL